MIEDDDTMAMTLPELAMKLRLMACHGGGTLTLDAKEAIRIAARLDREPVRYQVKINWRERGLGDVLFWTGAIMGLVDAAKLIAAYLRGLLG